MTKKVIEANGLSFSYNGHPVLEDVDLGVDAGDFLAVLGPNGGGKSTLIKILLGILPLQKGRALVLGCKPGQASDRIGYVPQNVTASEKFPVNVLDVVLMGRLGHLGRFRKYSKTDYSWAEKSLDQVEMTAYRSQLVSNLSGGQRQRVLIARALACDPEILFLDEPTASVDQPFHTRLYKLLFDLNSQGKTIVVISHDLSVLSSHAKSVACVNKNLYFHDSSEITQEMLEKAYHCPVELVTHGHVPHRVLKHHN
ncbi:metal ABC transporter ATP-binding protein [Desulfonatronovibrio hydrogenovorans]|uniref:metal ABC transporter ATP-binding protein n=1 Tax=Desulfonatronovibrio hydrogenovorans TaxID=53245 RepID=UPI00048BA9B8|nr:ABC transporter ATP-binding protein [Desulfonatronovibrio hydrogenovorans]